MATATDEELIGVGLSWRQFVSRVTDYPKVERALANLDDKSFFGQVFGSILKRRFQAMWARFIVDRMGFRLRPFLPNGLWRATRYIHKDNAITFRAQTMEELVEMCLKDWKARQ